MSAVTVTLEARAKWQACLVIGYEQALRDVRKLTEACRAKHGQDPTAEMILAFMDETFTREQDRAACLARKLDARAVNA